MTSPDRPTRPGLDIACALSTVTTGERNTAKAAVLEHRIEAVAELIASHAGDEWAAHPATDALAAILWPKSKPATAPAEPQPTERCGETTIGMYGRLLGPCLHPPGHPDLFHRDAHGAEWYEYDRTEPEPAASAAIEAADVWEQQDDGTWTLPVGDGFLLAVDADSTPEDRAQRAAGYRRGRNKNRPARSSPSAPCTDCITGAHGTNAHRKNLPPPRITPSGELRVLRLCVAAALSQHFLIHREDQQPQCCTEAVLAAITRKEGRQ